MTATTMRSEWQKQNALKCGCRGSDDYCVCQNDPDFYTRPSPKKADLHNPSAAMLEAVARCFDPPAWTVRQRYADNHRRTASLKKAGAAIAALSKAIHKETT